MTSHSQFVLEWEKALGWKDNPFQDKIFEPVENFLVGYEKERQKLNLFVIENYKYGLLLGDEGTGKTTLLRWMRNQLVQYRQRYLAIYLNANHLKTEQDLIRGFISPTLNIVEEWVTRPWKKVHIGNVIEFLTSRIKEKSIILLLDEAQMLSRPHLLILKHVFDSPLRIQLIVAGPAERMHKSIVSAFNEDKLGITLHGLKQEHIREMLALRIGALGGNGIEPFDDTIIRHIAHNPTNNPRYVLSLCNDQAIKLALKHTFAKEKNSKVKQKEKFFVIEDVEGDENEDDERGVADLFISNPLVKEEKPSSSPDNLEINDQIIQQAAAELKEAITKKAGKKKR